MRISWTARAADYEEINEETGEPVTVEGKVLKNGQLCNTHTFVRYFAGESQNWTNDDMKAVNTEADPDHVAPTHSDATKLENGKMHTVLGKHSWNVIRLTK